VPHWGSCTGRVVDVVPGTLYFTGQCQLCHIGNRSMSGSSDFDDQGNLSNGQLTKVTEDGSILAGTYWGTYSPQPTGQVILILFLEWGEGTGRLAGITGEAVVLGVTEGLMPGAAWECMMRGFLTLPK
jgi:hypothetical protein